MDSGVVVVRCSIPVSFAMSDGLLPTLEQLYRPSILFKLITSSLVNTGESAKLLA